MLKWRQGTDEDVWTPHDAASCVQLEAGASKKGLQVYAPLWWNAAHLKVNAGEKYRITAIGEWWDAYIRATAEGYDALMLVLLKGIRRVEKADWFRLIAAVHPAPGLESRNPTASNFFSGLIESHTHSLRELDAQSDLTDVGKDKVVEVRKAGYLYLFANDVGFAYCNNRGALTVTIERVG